MAKIKQKVNITNAEDAKIRRVWSEERSRWYFSVTDIMSVLTDSIDARNYWKALKNRLKTNHLQLVTDCNQLKMEASDGKSYLVDTADSDTIIKIIQMISPYNIHAFRAWFDHIEVVNSIKTDQENTASSNVAKTDGLTLETGTGELSTTLEPSIDIYENHNNTIVQVMLAGVSPDKIIIAVNMHTLTIKGKRLRPTNLSSKNINVEYLYNELQWGHFYREINFDTLIDVDQVEATTQRGLLNIKLPKIDQDKNRFIKIKSLGE